MSSVARWFPEEAEEIRQESRREGRQEGRQEGVIQGQALFLLRLLKNRFGEVPDVYRQRVESADADTLGRWADRVLAAEHIEQVFES